MAEANLGSDARSSNFAGSPFSEPSKCADASKYMEDMSSKDYYFDSYAHFGIHEEMIKDRIRTDTYRDSIYNSKQMFENKVVLDVGCGTGILSLFAANAGAKLVIGVDMSNIIDAAAVIIEKNNYKNKIVLLKGKMEEVTLPVDKVDIIISEWMGYCLLYESMLKTVLYARDKYLAPGGLIFPDKAMMYMSSIEDGEYRESKIDFWENVYGFDFSVIREMALREPLVDFVEKDTLNTEPYLLKSFDLYTMKEEDLEFVAPFVLVGTKCDYVHAFLVYFEVHFTACHVPLSISTSPLEQQTHWKQTVFYIRDNIPISVNGKINGTFSLKYSEKNSRDLDIRINAEHSGPYGLKKYDLEYNMR